MEPARATLLCRSIFPSHFRRRATPPVRKTWCPCHVLTLWEVRGVACTAVLTDPDRAIRVHLVVVEAPDVETGVASAWKLVDPSFNRWSRKAPSRPHKRRVEHALNVNYRTGDDKRLIGA
jgi:hypothetical protein